MIPVSKPIISKNAKKYLIKCIESGWISSSGPYVKEFEEKFAKILGVKFALTTSSGTSALHLALATLKIGQGDEVIIPTFTMIAPVFAILYLGAKPVLIDSEMKTWNMDVKQIEQKVTRKTKAIIVVHIYGHPIDMDSILRKAKKYNLYVIEDAAEALGAEYKNKKVGTFSDVACFSFYSNKTITTGEGGMVVTNNKKLAERLKLLKDMAHSPKKRFLHTEVAFTYRMTNLQAALGLAQLEEIEKMINHKRHIAKLYNSYLKDLPGLILPVEKQWAKSVFWMYGILTKSSRTKGRLRKRLLENGIDTRDFFIPMHRQPALLNLGLFKGEGYPVADHISNNGLYLPSGPDITDSQIKTVCSKLKGIYDELQTLPRRS